MKNFTTEEQKIKNHDDGWEWGNWNIMLSEWLLVKELWKIESRRYYRNTT